MSLRLVPSDSAKQITAWARLVWDASMEAYGGSCIDWEEMEDGEHAIQEGFVRELIKRGVRFPEDT